MSYTSKRLQQRASRSSLGPRGRGMAGAWDDWGDWWTQQFGGKTEDQQCMAAANAKTAELDAKTSDLSKNWAPTGLYSVAQIQSLVQSTMAMLLSASSTIDKAVAEPMADGSRSSLSLKVAAIRRKMSTEGLVFTNAIGTAMKNGINVVDAPGLKSWIVNSMNVSSDAISAAYYITCTTPWWVGALAAFQAAFDKVWGIAKQVAGVAVQLGQQVLKIPSAIGDIWTIAKYGAIGLIAWWAYENLPKHLHGA